MSSDEFSFSSAASPSQPAQEQPAAESAQPPPSPRCLLVPVDDSEECEHALQWAVDNVYRPGDYFIILHVIPTGQGASEFFSPSSPQNHASILENQAKHFIQQRFIGIIAPLHADCDVKIVESSTDSDSIGQQICIKAEECNAALVVMAAHNKGRLLKYLLGLATKFCVNHCRSTVLVHHL